MPKKSVKKIKSVINTPKVKAINFILPSIIIGLIVGAYYLFSNVFKPQQATINMIGDEKPLLSPPSTPSLAVNIACSTTPINISFTSSCDENSYHKVTFTCPKNNLNRRPRAITQGNITTCRTLYEWYNIAQSYCQQYCPITTPTPTPSLPPTDSPKPSPIVGSCQYKDSSTGQIICNRFTSAEQMRTLCPSTIIPCDNITYYSPTPSPTSYTSPLPTSTPENIVPAQ